MQSWYNSSCIDGRYTDGFKKQKSVWTRDWHSFRNELWAL